MSYFKHFLVLIITPAVPHGTFKMKVAFCVTAVFTPVLAKHSKSFSLIDCISVGVDRMQRSFEPMRKQVEAWQRTNSPTSPPRWSSTRHSWRVNSKRRSTLLELYTTYTSNRSMKNSGHKRFGVSPMHSLLHSRNWVQFRSLRPRRSSVNSWRPAFHNRSDLRGGTGRATPPESIYSEVFS